MVSRVKETMHNHGALSIYSIYVHNWWKKVKAWEMQYLSLQGSIITEEELHLHQGISSTLND